MTLGTTNISITQIIYWNKSISNIVTTNNLGNVMYFNNAMISNSNTLLQNYDLPTKWGTFALMWDLAGWSIKKIEVICDNDTNAYEVVNTYYDWISLTSRAKW